MKFNELITKRFSVRSYTNQNVSRETILEILEAARMAPSAVNFQPWHFIVITEPAKRSELQKAYPREWFCEAPVYILVCADHRHSWKRKSDGKDFADVDVAIAIDHLMLKATELELGTCWVCNFNPEIVRQLFQLPDFIEPVAIIPMGYSTATAPEKSRKTLTETVHWNQFTGL